MTPEAAILITTLQAQVAAAREALIFYASRAAGCRMITAEGDEARQALDRDGGAIALSTLAKLNEQENGRD